MSAQDFLAGMQVIDDIVEKDKVMKEKKRVFDTGANRNSEEGKLDFEGFLSPLVIHRYAEYLDSHRRLEDGTLRDSDNWQRGMPLSVYMKSAFRHFMAWWSLHRMMVRDRYPNQQLLEDAVCGLIFNASGYLHEQLVEPREVTDSARVERREGERRSDVWGDPEIGRRGSGTGRRFSERKPSL